MDSTTREIEKQVSDVMQEDLTTLHHASNDTQAPVGVRIESQGCSHQIRKDVTCPNLEQSTSENEQQKRKEKKRKMS